MEPDRREDDDTLVVPVVEEELATDRVPVKTGSVRVEKHVERRIRKIDMPLLHEEVDIRRVPVNRPVEAAPRVRKEGDTIIVPVVEEELVITKRLVLKEEIHLVRRRGRDRMVKEVALDRETAEVQRLDADGRIVDPPRSPRRTPKKRGLLE